MSYYDYGMDLNEEATRYYKRYEKSGAITTDRMWQNQSWGSAACASASWSGIFDAYEESKICEEW